MSDAPPPPPDGLGIFESPHAAATEPSDDIPAYGEVVERRVAHPARRAFAFLIDGTGTVFVTVIVVFGGLFLGFIEALTAIVWVPAASTVLATVLTATIGVTPGKWLLRLRVVHVETGRVTGVRAILRSLVIVAPIVATYGALQLFNRLAVGDVALVDPLVGTVLMPAVLWIALFVVVVATPQHRGLEDLAGRSVVVER